MGESIAFNSTNCISIWNNGSHDGASKLFACKQKWLLIQYLKQCIAQSRQSKLEYWIEFHESGENT